MKICSENVDHLPSPAQSSRKVSHSLGVSSTASAMEAPTRKPGRLAGRWENNAPYTRKRRENDKNILKPT